MWQYNELYHHGIKGQKWGVRRFQNEDGTRTEAGRKRYVVDIEGAKNNLSNAKTEYNNARKLLDQGRTQQRSSAYAAALKNLDWARRDLHYEKIKEKLNSETKKSKHRQKLEEEYRKNGMSEEEAAVAAYKRARTEKAIAAVGGVALASAAAYIAYKEYDKRVDRVLDSDISLKRVANNGDLAVHDAFYAAYKNKDTSKYIGGYGAQLKNNGADKVYQKSIGVSSGLKIASDHNAYKTLKDMAQGSPGVAPKLSTEIRNQMRLYEKAGYDDTKQYRILAKAYKDLESGKVTPKVYDAFNFNLSGGGGDLGKSFYSKLKEKGYDAISDRNDRRYSGYDSKDPLIIFNTAKVRVESAREVPLEEIQRANNKFTSGVIAKQRLKSFGGRGALLGSIVGAAVLGDASAKKKAEDKVVQEYRKEHPDTKLSYNEILKNYSGQKADRYE